MLHQEHFSTDSKLAILNGHDVAAAFPILYLKNNEIFVRPQVSFTVDELAQISDNLRKLFRALKAFFSEQVRPGDKNLFSSSLIFTFSTFRFSYLEPLSLCFFKTHGALSDQA